jgi:hypothetical protein
MKIKSDLEEARKVLSNIPYIHAGGCGISALALSRWIKKTHLTCDVQFVLGYNDLGRFKTNSDMIADPSNCKAKAVGHAGLIVDFYDGTGPRIIDCKGPYPIMQYSYCHTFSDENIMLKSINNVSDWNTEFDRDNVPIIAEKLGISLFDVDCSTHAEALQGITMLAKTEVIPKWYNSLFKLLKP